MDVVGVGTGPGRTEESTDCSGIEEPVTYPLSSPFPGGRTRDAVPGATAVRGQRPECLLSIEGISETFSWGSAIL